MNVKTLKNIIQSGGATLNKKGFLKKYKKGFQVSKKDCYILSLNNLQDILEKTNTLIKELKSDEFLGLWVDNEKIYIDISIKINNKNKAIEKGLKLKQISIFCWATGDCIYL